MVELDKNKIIKGVIILFSFIIIDQIVKYFTRINQPNIDLGLLKIVFLQNTGIAFSFFTGYNFFLMLLGIILVGVSLYFYKYL